MVAGERLSLEPSLPGIRLLVGDMVSADTKSNKGIRNAGRRHHDTRYRRHDHAWRTDLVLDSFHGLPKAPVVSWECRPFPITVGGPSSVYRFLASGVVGLCSEQQGTQDTRPIAGEPGHGSDCLHAPRSGNRTWPPFGE